MNKKQLIDALVTEGFIKTEIQGLTVAELKKLLIDAKGKQEKINKSTVEVAKEVVKQAEEDEYIDVYFTKFSFIGGYPRYPNTTARIKKTSFMPDRMRRV